MAYISFQPKDYFNTKLYTGNDTAQTITGIPFAPSWVWIKNRSASENHVLVDAVRGANNFISSNTTSSNNTNTEFVKSLTSDGYTLGNADEVNNGSNNFVAWNWKANGQGSSNTDGTINTTYTSASSISGFSISQYTGTGSNATVGHGLGVAPKIVLVKDLSASGSWRMYTEMTGNESQLALDQTSAADSGSTTMWNSTSPTTTTFSIGTHGNVNTSSNNYIAYCFAEVKGYSKIGYYVGNQNANGSFIFTGFKPAFILSKKIDGASDWYIFDSKREGYNFDNDTLLANQTTAESTTDYLDILSNGYKVRTTDGDLNTNNGEYVYMAFAEEPFVASNGVPATAR